MLPNIDAQGNLVPMQKSLLLMTTQYLIFMRVFNFVDLLSDENLARSLLLSERLKNILYYCVTKFEQPGLDGDQYMLYLRFRKPRTTMKMTRKQRRRAYHGGRRSGGDQTDQSDTHDSDPEEDAPWSSGLSEESFIFSSSADGTFDRGTKAKQSQNSLDSASPTKEGKPTHMDTFNESEDGETKYQFAIYSPSFEILKRLHALFSQVPEIQ